MIKNNKGITLIALVVTIIILLILAVTGFYYGDLSVESSKFERLSSQMQTMQLKLNQLYEEKSKIDITGEDVAESNDSFSVVEKKNIEIGNKSDYKSYTYVQVEEIFGIKDVEQDLRFLINFKKRRVIIDGGYTYDNTTYYVIEDFKDVFNVDYNGFKYDVKDGIGNSTITISGIELGDGDKVSYKKDTSTWVENQNDEKNIIVLGEKGTYSLKVELLDGKIVEYDNVEVNPIEADANSPELTEEMIPVTWNRERLSWIKADKDNLDNSWYNYNKDSNMWANVVTVNQNGTYSREFYQNAEIGTEILMSDINGMFVWIPRFTYNATRDENNKITTVDGIRYSNDIDDNVSYSKEGIDFGEAKGIWVSKFECSNDSNGNLNVKPNVNSVKNIVYNGENGAYTISQNLTTDNNIYGFDSVKISSDIIKDSDWEAVAILSKGVTSNAMIYNNSYFEGNKDNVAITRTGMVGIGAEGSENTSTTETSFEKIIKTENTGKISLGNAKNFYEYWTNEGQKASTTQNVYGIYDMSGGGSEYVQKEEDKVWIRGGTFSVYEDILEGASEGEQNKSYSDVSFRVILTVK